MTVVALVGESIKAREITFRMLFNAFDMAVIQTMNNPSKIGFDLLSKKVYGYNDNLICFYQ